jgi:hypothetical protein
LVVISTLSLREVGNFMGPSSYCGWTAQIRQQCRVYKKQDSGT